MEKITKLSLKGLRKSFHELSIEELMEILGGSDCVLQVYSEVSGYSVEWWVDMVESNYGYNVYGNGGLNQEDIIPIGGMGGLNVNEIKQAKPSDLNKMIANGTTLMVSFHGGTVAHAATVTYVDADGGCGWKDSAGNTGYIPASQTEGLYSVEKNEK